MIPTLIYMAVAEQGIGPILSQEIFPEIPLYLLLAICGAPVTISGLMVFRDGVKEMIRQAELQTQMRELEITGVDNHEVEEELSRSLGVESESPARTPQNKRELQEQGVKKEASLIKVKTAGTTIICLSCGETLPLGSTNCTKCGARLEIESNPEKACPVCGGNLAKAAKLGDNIYICGLCFSELEVSPDLASRIFK
ncbi:MAG: hypothetical protein QXV24_05190 [Nitrososphaerota archaeon]